MEEKKSLKQLSRLEYLDWYILHETQCLKNHKAIPGQISIFLYVFFLFSNLLCSSVPFFISFLNVKMKNSQTQLISSVESGI